MKAAIIVVFLAIAAMVLLPASSDLPSMQATSQAAPPAGPPLQVPTRTPKPTATVTSTPTPTPWRSYLPAILLILPPTPTPTATPEFTSGVVHITAINARGSGQSQPDEYVEFRNCDTHAIQLYNWTLRDDEQHVFRFPNFVMEPHQVCRVYTDEYHPEFCGFSYHSSSSIWDDSGECAFLRNSFGTPIDTRCY